MLWIGMKSGPEQQGQFNQLKSLIDLSIALAAMGIPQALYVYVQSNQMSFNRAWKTSLWIGPLGMATGAVVMLWSTQSSPALIAVVGATAVAGCLHAQWRVLTLLSPQTIWFNLVTVAPQVLLLPIAAWIAASGHASQLGMSNGMLLAWATGAVVAGLVLKRLPARPLYKEAVPIQKIFTHGLATGVTGFLSILTIVLMQKAAQQSFGDAGMGVISMAMLLTQIPMTPLNYALPLLLKNRLTQLHTPQYYSYFLMATTALMMILVCAVWLLGAVRSDLWMGFAYSGIHLLLAIFLLAGSAEIVLRIMSVEAQATMRPWKSTLAEAVRVCTLLGLWLGSQSERNPQTLEMLATFWLIATIAAMVTFKLSNRYSRLLRG